MDNEKGEGYTDIEVRVGGFGERRVEVELRCVAIKRKDTVSQALSVHIYSHKTCNIPCSFLCAMLYLYVSSPRSFDDVDEGKVRYIEVITSSVSSEGRG